MAVMAVDSPTSPLTLGKSNSRTTPTLIAAAILIALVIFIERQPSNTYWKSSRKTFIIEDPTLLLYQQSLQVDGALGAYTTWPEHCLPIIETEGWLPRKSKKTFVLLMGLEGSGHHLVSTGLDDVANRAWSSNPDNYGWTKETQYTRAFWDEFTALLDQQEWFTNGDVQIAVAGADSCPTGQKNDLHNRSPLRCPDPMLFLEAQRRGILEVKFIFLSRSFSTSVMSALRRQFASDVEMQLRVEEFSSAYLNSMLSALPCRQTMIFPYDQLSYFDNTPILAKFLNVSFVPKFEQISEKKARGHSDDAFDHTFYCQEKGLTGIKCTNDVEKKVMEFAEIHAPILGYLPV